MSRLHLLAVVDDDESLRGSLPPLLRLHGYDVETFSSAEDFLAADALQRVECVILDVAMPGMSGPELQREIIRRGLTVPIVFITAHASGGGAELIEAGAACLIKPFSEEAIIVAVERALGGNSDAHCGS